MPAVCRVKENHFLSETSLYNSATVLRSPGCRFETGGVIIPDTGGSLSKDGDNPDEFVSEVVDIKPNIKPGN